MKIKIDLSTYDTFYQFDGCGIVDRFYELVLPIGGTKFPFTTERSDSLNE